MVLLKSSNQGNWISISWLLRTFQFHFVSSELCSALNVIITFSQTSTSCCTNSCICLHVLLFLHHNSHHVTWTLLCVKQKSKGEFHLPTYIHRLLKHSVLNKCLCYKFSNETELELNIPIISNFRFHFSNGLQSKWSVAAALTSVDAPTELRAPHFLIWWILINILGFATNPDWCNSH